MIFDVDGMRCDVGGVKDGWMEGEGGSVVVIRALDHLMGWSIYGWSLSSLY